MALFNDTYCQLCERFLTEEAWNVHLYSSRHLQKGVNWYWPTKILQRILTRDEGSTLEKTLWEMIFGSVDVLPVYGSWKTYFMMVTSMKDYVTKDNDDDDADFRNKYIEKTTSKIKQDSYNIKTKINATIISEKKKN